MSTPIPPVGTSGTFQVAPPFDVLINSRVSYTVMSIRSLSEIIANGSDPYVLYYQPNNISTEVYKKDLTVNINIISLLGSDNKWVYIPATYVLAYPDMTGVPYHVLSLAVALGAVPLDYDPSALSTMISNLVTDTIGVTPEINPVEISAVNYLTNSEDAMVKAKRDLLIANRVTDTAKYRYALDMYHQTLNQLRAVECFITNSCGLCECTEDIAPSDIVYEDVESTVHVGLDATWYYNLSCNPNPMYSVRQLGTETLITKVPLPAYTEVEKTVFNGLDAAWYYKRSCYSNDLYATSLLDVVTTTERVVNLTDRNIKVCRDYKTGVITVTTATYIVILKENLTLELYRRIGADKTLLFVFTNHQLSILIDGRPFVSKDQKLENDAYRIGYCENSKLGITVKATNNTVCVGADGSLDYANDACSLRVDDNGNVYLALKNGRRVKVSNDCTVAITDDNVTDVYPVPTTPPGGVIDSPPGNWYPGVNLTNFSRNCLPVDPVRYYIRDKWHEYITGLGSYVVTPEVYVPSYAPISLNDSLAFKNNPYNAYVGYSLQYCNHIYKDLGESGYGPVPPIVSFIDNRITLNDSVVYRDYPINAEYAFTLKCTRVMFKDLGDYTVTPPPPAEVVDTRVTLNDSLVYRNNPPNAYLGYSLRHCQIEYKDLGESGTVVIPVVENLITLEEHLLNKCFPQIAESTYLNGGKCSYVKYTGLGDSGSEVVPPIVTSDPSYINIAKAVLDKYYPLTAEAGYLTKACFNI